MPCRPSAFSPLLFFLILPLIFIFLIGTANFYNFMDGINGIAGLSGVIGFGLLGLYTLYRPNPDPFQTPLSLLSICIALACLGYLPFNMPRARVFMGDVGSILLGFVFAGLVVTLARNYLEMVCFAALLFPFYADELTTMVVRLRDRENLTRSHRRHLYQLLVNEFGIAHWKISAAYAVAQLAIGAGALIAYPCRGAGRPDVPGGLFCRLHASDGRGPQTREQTGSPAARITRTADASDVEIFRLVDEHDRDILPDLVEQTAPLADEAVFASDSDAARPCTSGRPVSPAVPY